MIHDVVVQPLRQIPDERGKVMHMLRADSPLYTRFGEIYFSLVYPGVVKAWHRHRATVQHLAVPVGMVRFGLYDDRDGSPSRGVTQVFEIGESAYQLLRIPPGVWYGFQAIGPHAALVANCIDLPYDPAEVERLGPSDPHMPHPWRPG